MDLIHAAALALIQGITEFLPISSSAHLILPGKLLGWPDQGLAFDTAVHLGSLIAVLFYFRADLLRLARAGGAHLLGGQASADSRFAANLILASLPILPVGYFARYMVEAELRDIGVIAFTTIFFALLLWLADHRRKGTEVELTPARALLIGAAQCLALVPGTSRSGITMTAALLAGYSREYAARISLLISIPTIAGAAAIKLADVIRTDAQADWLAIGLGTVLAGTAAYICIDLLLRLVERIGFLPFVIYRLVLGTLLVGLLVL